MSGPAYHARTHLQGGTDPIRGLLPAGDDLLDIILALGAVGVWPLDETSGTTAHDHSGNDRHLLVGTDDPPTWAQDEGPPGSVTAEFSTPAQRLSYGAYPTLTGGDFTVAGWVYYTDSAPSDAYALMGQGTATTLGQATTDGWLLAIHGGSVGPGPNKLALYVGDGTGPVTVITSNDILEEATWYHVAAVRASGTFKLYVEGLLQTETSTDSISAGDHDLVFGSTSGAGSDYHLVGRGSWWAVFDRALTSTELLEIASGEGGPDPGDVLVIDPVTGEPVWGPAGTEVEHGDGDPEENPTIGHDAFLGPVDGAGWHLQLHYEYVVLYDSSPGRFDVPPRKWTRVPFNTVRIQRSWEHAPAGSGDFTSAWLAEDRGLTEHARNGLLLVTAGMLFNPGELTVSGWFSIEYPMGDVTRMPGYGTVHGAAYQRAARMTNTSNGSVLKIGTGWGSYKGFFEWPFTAADGDDANAIGYLADNPYPVYLPWAARPLNKPLPYPKLSNAESLTRYKTPVVGEPGFRLDQMVSDAALAAGDALSLQAWQDTPWLLRFGTDKYPPYTPLDYVEQWRARPALVLFHFYDPATVDHATGLLL